MDRRGTRDKMATTPEVTEETPRCEHCGRPLSDYGCRAVPMGFWCLMAGLIQDPRTIIAPSEDPRKALVETDPQVMKAKAEYQVAAEEAERVRLEWEGVAAVAHVADQQRRAVVQTVLVDGEMQDWTPAGTPSAREIYELNQQRDTLFHVKDHAAERMIKARHKLDAAKQQAWRRLASAAA
jgi:hypothetical protein